jgi:TolB-like protein
MRVTKQAQDQAAAGGSDAGRPPSVFVSYSRDDRARATPLIAALESRGFDVWWDGLLAVGDAFAQTTETALESASTVLVLWSARSIQSHWVRDEATRGRDRGCMVPVSLDGSEPPLGFRQIQYIDLSRWTGDPAAPQLAELIAAIERTARSPGKALSLSHSHGLRPTTTTTRRRAIVAGAAALAAAGGAGLAWRAGLLGTAAASNSLAVLPFRNLSGNPDQDYFSEGLSEELRTTLSLNRQLAVAAQASSQSIADAGDTAAGIAARLGVAFLLEGSVRRAGDQLRITAQLIDGASGFEKWSNIFERRAEDVLAVQSEIAATVVDALSVAIGGDPAASSIRAGGTEDAAAFDHYLKGLALYQAAGGEASDRRALAEFDRAIGIDPQYAAAHAARSRALTVIGSSYATGQALKALYAAAIDAARAATRLAPDMAEGHSAMGLALMNGRLDMAAARDPYRKSFELGFGNAPILAAYAQFAANVGDIGQANAAMARAQTLDPLNFATFRSAAIVAFAARDFPAAKQAVRSALALNDTGGAVHRILGDIAILAGDPVRARAEFAAEPSAISRLRGLAIADYRIDGAAAGERRMRELIAQFGDNALFQQGEVLAQWGRVDDALAALEKAFIAGDSGLALARADPLLDPIRQSPRFAALLSSLGFT